MDNQKNLLLAVVFSIAVLFGFDFFFGPNKTVQQDNIVDNSESLKNDKSSSIDTEAPSIKAPPSLSVKQNNNYNEKRINFKANRIEGSINLFGATIDEIILSDYFETIKKEKKIKLLQKENSNSPYFLRMGWASTDKKLMLPNKDSLWKSKTKTNNNDPLEIEWASKQGLKINRKISFDENFMITIEDIVLNQTGNNVELTNYSYIRRKNHRPENKFFILHEGPLGVFNDTLKEFSYEDFEEQSIVESSTNGWVGYTDHYWQVAIFPDTEEPFKAEVRKIKNSVNSIQIDFINDNLKTVKPGETLTVKSYVFAGAKEVPLIDNYIKTLKVNKLDLSVDFGWFYFLTKPLFYALNYLSVLFTNFGVGIIILTIFIRIILFPLANKSFKSMNSMRILTPEIQRIRERYKDDRNKMNQEMFALYREKNQPCSWLSANFNSNPNFLRPLQSFICFNRNETRPFFWVDKRFICTRSNKFIQFVWPDTLGPTYVLNNWNLASLDGINNVFTTKNKSSTTRSNSSKGIYDASFYFYLLTCYFSFGNGRLLDC